jgi:hypothetical protein
MTEEKKPLRLSEVQREMQGGGLRCPKCDCIQFKVVGTWRAGDGLRRARVCRACGHRFNTTEQP